MDVRKRKRGIKASREKLEAAMLSKGFRTQRELAHQIALDENIDTPPKDLVNKVFREQAVSIINLNRIAKALEVEPHALYLAKDDTAVEDVLLEQSHREAPPPSAKTQSDGKDTAINARTKPRSNNKFSLVVLVVLILSLGFVVSVYNNTDHPDTRISSALGKILIIIQADAESQDFAKALSAAFINDDDINVLVSQNSLLYNAKPTKVLETSQAHALVRIQTQSHQIHHLLRVSIYSDKHQADILQKISQQKALVLNQKLYVEQAKQQLKRFVSGQPIEGLYTQNRAAMEAFIKGMDTRFLSYSLEDLQSSKDYFNQALSEDSSMTYVYAQRCLIDVRISWMQEELKWLESAAENCQLAAQKATDDMYTQLAQLELALKTGESDRAAAIEQDLSDYDEVNADVFASLAEYALNMATEDASGIQQDTLVEYAKQALAIEARHWRAANTLVNYYFSIGDIHAAKQYSIKASQVVNHPVILSNLGTLQLCHDELDNAALTYQRIIDSSPDNYLGHENLGTIHLMQGNYVEANKHKQIAFDQQPDIAIHEVWSGLAQSYALIGKTEEALDLYTQALSIIERDELLEISNMNHALHKAYYQFKIKQLSSDVIEYRNYRALVKDLIEQRSQLGLKARSHLAWLAGEIGFNDEKTMISEEIVNICPVYQRAPELKSMYL